MKFLFNKRKIDPIDKVSVDIPDSPSTVQLDKRVDQLLLAHNHFTKVLQEFTEDVHKFTGRK